ncbi:MAG: alkaline phosphatase, partial [Victivallaceae bacterium]|nr:alkaline phosphatase [Victivallaceae bacterium]
MKRFLCIAILLSAAAVFAVAKPKYIFLFIGDGMSTPQRMTADEFSRKTGAGKLFINDMPFHATTRTSSANSLVTDSAASGTAIACGEKTANGRIGMAADGVRKLESCAEAAKKAGKKVGIVTSVTINHATPASFYAHRASRGQYYAIGLDLVDSGFDYFGGGGCAKHDASGDPLYRGDIYELAARAGYKVVSGKAGLSEIVPGTGKVFARGDNDGALPFAIDAAPGTATLADFTEKGIELLDNPQGFFMMVEGGAIDWCGHSNDAAGNLREVLAFDRAVEKAVAFAEKHPDETLIVVTGDHETGGMTMGFAGTGYALYVERLAGQKCSVAAFAQKLKAAQAKNPAFSFADAKLLLAENFGFDFSGASPMALTAPEIAVLEKAFADGKLADAARRTIAAKAGAGWTSSAHTALP